VLVARGPHGATIRQAGLTVRGPDGDTTLELECVASSRDVDFRADDVVVLGVKSHQVDDAIADIEPSVAVVCTQNGVTAEVAAARRFDRVYGMMSWIPAVHLEPGVVEVYAREPAGVFRVGHHDGGVDATAEALASDMSRGGFDAAAVIDIMRWKRAKLLNNLGNVLDAFCVREPGLVDVSFRAQAEGAKVLTAANLPFMPAAELFEDMRGRLDHRATIDGRRRAGGSTWQSATRGLATEVDHLNGYICRLGEDVKIATPVNRVLASLPGIASGPRSVPLARVLELLDRSIIET
jgi:2-dehydropantoate 2-reductase